MLRVHLVGLPSRLFLDPLLSVTLLDAELVGDVLGSLAQLLLSLAQARLRQLALMLELLGFLHCQFRGTLELLLNSLGSAVLESAVLELRPELGILFVEAGLHRLDCPE